jgi:protein involved in polysaccharide export with SLBB domain
MSAPSSGAAVAPGSGPIQQTNPLPIPSTQAPTIVNPAQPTQQQIQQLQRPQPSVATKPASEPGAERNEFQEFITASSGKKLPMFGFNLFEAPSTFAPVENIPVTPDYVIGPGDELLVRAWGQIDVDYRAVVDRNGMINIPRVGSIPVAGVRYQDLTSHVRTAVSRNFRNFELLVTMGQLRSVQIFVVGHARRPGAYTVSSLSTLVNAIFAAGGPTGHGSLRAIQLKRGNSVVSEIDLYELLLSGDKSKDVPLLPGDRPARRGVRQRQQRRHLRAQGPDQRRQAP